MAAAETALPEGYSLQEYRIDSTLGVGGFGLTYLATDSNLNLKVAIKEYLPSELASRCDDQSVKPKSNKQTDTFKWGLDRFLDESRTLASFRHPNIVRVMRFFQANQTAYMVMEFVAGQSLSEWVRTRRPVEDAAVRGILLPLLEGLSVVHKSGYLHRDIKPGNIFIRDDGSPVLLDFGSARMVGQGAELTAIVTPGYAPLEQYHSHGKQGPWSDLYALGGVLYWLVTGSKPIEAAARVRTDPMPPAAKACDPARYSPDLLAIIDWMLVPPEDRRPQSVADVVAALRPGGDSTRQAGEATVRIAEATAIVQPVSSSTSMPTGGALDRDMLKQIEAELVKHIGPVAPAVIRSAAKKVVSIAQLAEAVAKDIEDETARAKFLRRYSAGEKSRPSGEISRPSGPSQTVPTALAAQRFDLKVLAGAETELAQYLGPLARVVVKRAAMKARDESELYLLIADEIEDASERKTFLRKAVARRQ